MKTVSPKKGKMLPAFFFFFPCVLLLSQDVYKSSSGNFPEGETVRTRAEKHFSSFEWTDRTDMESRGYPAPERIKKILRDYGGTREESSGEPEDSSEEFPLLSLGAASSLMPVIPEIADAGSLDFSSVPGPLVSFFQELSEALKNGDFSQLNTAENGEFLPFFLGARLQNLPPVEDVYFAGIEMSGDKSKARSVFRMRFPAASSGARVSVFAVVEALSVDGEWKLRDMIFNGDSYAKAVEQTGT